MDEKVNDDEPGDLKLTSEQEIAFVAFLRTHSDGCVADRYRQSS